MRYFNIYGPVNETEHYVVPRSELIADLVAQIERGTYFTIFAPRQMGKTTLLRRLRDVLQERQIYLPITLSFEAFESWSVSDFLHAFGEGLTKHIVQSLPPEEARKVQKQLPDQPPGSFFALRTFFDALGCLAPTYRLVLIIDEFDATPQAAISPLLQTWRAIYLESAPPRSLHSVALVGIQNIATLNLDRSSPFNIARQVRLPDFTLAEVRAMLEEYTAETGQRFELGVIERIYHQTGGHPFLVNRLAGLLTEEIALDRAQPVTATNLDTALQQLVRERNYNFETILRQANPRRDDVLNILFGVAYEFNLNRDYTDLFFQNRCPLNIGFRHLQSHHLVMSSHQTFNRYNV
jgi:hypothetical protein